MGRVMTDCHVERSETIPLDSDTLRFFTHLREFRMTKTRAFSSLRASGASVAINKQGIPIRLIASLTLAITPLKT